MGSAVAHGGGLEGSEDLNSAGEPASRSELFRHDQKEWGGVMSGKRSVLAVLISAALVTGVIGQLPDASAGKKKKRVERTAQADYLGASGFRGAVEGSCDAPPIACVRIPVEPGEKFVSVEVTDASGQPVWASVYIYGYTDPAMTHEHVCGASEIPFALGSGLEELVVVVTQTTGGATSPCTGAATTGTVTATFSNLP